MDSSGFHTDVSSSSSPEARSTSPAPTHIDTSNSASSSNAAILSDLLRRNGMAAGQVQNGVGLEGASASTSSASGSASASGGGSAAAGGSLFNMNWGGSLGNGSAFGSTVTNVNQQDQPSLNGRAQGFPQGQAGLYTPLMMENNSSSVGSMQSLPMLYGLNLNGMSAPFSTPADLAGAINSSATTDAAFATALQLQVQRMAQCAPKPGPQLKLVTSRSSSARVLRSKSGLKANGHPHLPIEGSNRAAWTPEEDARLIEIVNHVGPKRWSHISRLLSTGRSSKQCRERWSNQINPALNRSKWTEEEDNVILRLHKKHGNRWALIADSLPGRTDNMIKNRFNGSLKMKQSRNSSSLEEPPVTLDTSASSSAVSAGPDRDRQNLVPASSPQEQQEQVAADVSVLGRSRKKQRSLPSLKISTPLQREVEFQADLKQTPPSVRQSSAKAGFSVSPQEQKTIMGKRMPSSSGEWKAIKYELGKRNAKNYQTGVVHWHPGKNIATLNEPHGRGPWSGTVTVPKSKSLKITGKLLLKLKRASEGITRPSALGKRKARAPSKDNPEGHGKLRRKAKAVNGVRKAGQPAAHVTAASWPKSSSRCKCRKSKCLKLYCDCFANQSHCGIQCKCLECNNKEPNGEWQAAYQMCINRKSTKQWKKAVPASACKCKSTHCLKKYCDCFRTGRPCTVKCACASCMNTE